MKENQEKNGPRKNTAGWRGLSPTDEVWVGRIGQHLHAADDQERNKSGTTLCELQDIIITY